MVPEGLDHGPEQDPVAERHLEDGFELGEIARRQHGAVDIVVGKPLGILVSHLMVEAVHVADEVDHVDDRHSTQRLFTLQSIKRTRLTALCPGLPG